jgi:hypothetical protein
LLLCEIATDLKLTIRFSEKVLRLQSSTSEASRRQERARLEEEQGVWTTTVPRMLASFPTRLVQHMCSPVLRLLRPGVCRNGR